mgnify:CR=1 FL=1
MVVTFVTLIATVPELIVTLLSVKFPTVVALPPKETVVLPIVTELFANPEFGIVVLMADAGIEIVEIGRAHV